MVVGMRMTPIGSSEVELFERIKMIRRCGIVGVGVGLLEEVYHWG